MSFITVLNAGPRLPALARVRECAPAVPLAGGSGSARSALRGVVVAGVAGAVDRRRRDVTVALADERRKELYGRDEGSHQLLDRSG